MKFSKANFNTFKIIYVWPPFMKAVDVVCFIFEVLFTTILVFFFNN